MAMELDKVYCYKCGWLGTIDQLEMLEVDALDEDGDTEFVEELTDPNRVAERRRIREISRNVFVR